MIIDAHNTIQLPRPEAPEPGRREALTPEQLLAAMDRTNISRSVICPNGRDLAIENQYIVDSVTRFPDRFIGFAAVNPRDPKAAESIRLYSRGGVKGVMLHPLAMGYAANSQPLLAPIFKACSELGLIVYSHCFHDYGATPLQYEETARVFPDVPLILGHMGIVWSVGDAIAVATRNPNVYLETSVASLNAQRSAVRAAGAAKVVMGTDWPSNDFDLQIEMARRATNSAKEFDLVVGGNLKVLLNLE